MNQVSKNLFIERFCINLLALWLLKIFLLRNKMSRSRGWRKWLPWLQTLLIVKQILLVSTLGNAKGTVWTICILMLWCNVWCCYINNAFGGKERASMLVGWRSRMCERCNGEKGLHEPMSHAVLQPHSVLVKLNRLTELCVWKVSSFLFFSYFHFFLQTSLNFSCGSKDYSYYTK